MIVAVAERDHSPQMDIEDVVRWNQVWHTAPLSCMLSSHAIQGPTRTRLNQLMNVNPDRILHLLPPDRRSGLWDQSFAAHCADKLLPWLISNAQGIILLGRRVIDVFTADTEFCVITQVCQVPTLCLPGPGDVSRFMAAPDNRDKIGAAIRQFTENISREE